MATLLLLIREPFESGASAESIVGAICPYLDTFGGSAKASSVRRYHELRGGEPAHRVTAVEIEVAGTARLELNALAAKLERFLKQTAKDADLTAGFEILHARESGSSEAPRI